MTTFYLLYSFAAFAINACSSLGPRIKEFKQVTEKVKHNELSLPTIRIPESFYDFYKSAAQTYVDNKDGFSSKYSQRTFFFIRSESLHMIMTEETRVTDDVHVCFEIWLIFSRDNQSDWPDRSRTAGYVH